ncbi:single-stranded DNA-binding protein [Pedobacter sp. ISL-68]|uniref:single-stranded DNA-binding protein n=1 Tax=unclassified Pedobacter TaxID=2628915 RepID=UPI001BE54E8B|nr:MULTISPECIES: single-stranded DNA-binding protein [unclassified Pedobacter]MBT2564876.1 single-stranded DNA-binding protein [Pedobacter sp. ISL-64]MBT2593433.1 single-stranded DNA-binding protein [Pedobacter sp. ISL-68]
MESAINKVVLSGFAGADAEIKTFGNQKLARVNLAINESYRNAAGEDIKKVQWFNLTFWNAKAEIAEAQVKKGTGLRVEGRLQANSYDSKDGKKRYGVDVVVSDVIIRENEKQEAF